MTSRWSIRATAGTQRYCAALCFFFSRRRGHTRFKWDWSSGVCSSDLSLVSVDALQEFRIETSSVSPEFGRSPGAQVLLTTRSGTNQFHGGIFEYFRNDVLDAND